MTKGRTVHQKNQFYTLIAVEARAWRRGVAAHSAKKLSNF